MRIMPGLAARKAWFIGGVFRKLTDTHTRTMGFVAAEKALTQFLPLCLAW